VQTIAARLWDDPLVALHRNSNVSMAKPTAIPNDLCHAITPGRTKRAFHVVLLIAMVSNANYIDSSERRSRLRFAVVPALNEAHMTPHDPQHIGAIAVSVGDENSATEVLIPFEIFRRKGDYLKTGQGDSLMQRAASAPKSAKSAAKSQKIEQRVVAWVDEETVLAGLPARPFASVGGVEAYQWFSMT